MSEVELEPDRNRLHDLVRLVWESAQPADGSTAPAGERVAVTDQEIADAGPYSVEQIRDHLTVEQEGTYLLERAGETIRVAAVQEA